MSLFMTTTALQIDPELMNRCLMLTVDETPEQTERIHALQGAQDTLQGLRKDTGLQDVRGRHHVLQRILEPIRVVNPYAQEIELKDKRVRSRRDYRKLLNLVQAVTFLHQYQRPKKVVDNIPYIESTKEDVELAARLFESILVQEDLPPQTQKLFHILQKEVVRQSEVQKLTPSELYFTRRNVREWTGYSVDQVRHHMHRLVELELVRITKSGKGKPIQYTLDGVTLGGVGEAGSPGGSHNQIISLWGCGADEAE